MHKFLPFLLAGGLGPAWGQQAAPAAQPPAAVAAARQQYTEVFASSPQLINGPEYIDYSQLYRSRTGHQFFLAPEQQPGSVYYQGHLFQHLRLAYDVVRDQVVLSQPTSPLTLRLVNEWVSYFFIQDHQFVRLVAGAASGLPRTGYYELLADGPVQVLARRAKYQQEKLTQAGTDVAFLPADRLWVQRAGRYYPAAGKRAVLRLFADRAGEVQQYAQAQQLSFRRDQLEATTVALARYYAALPPQ